MSWYYLVKGEKRVIEVDWLPVLNADAISKYVVSLRDVTETRTLQMRNRELDRRSAILLHLFSMDLGLFERFASDLDSLLDSFDSLEKTLILSRLHEYKGTARALGMDRISELIHQVEGGINQGDETIRQRQEIEEVLQEYTDLKNEVYPENTRDQSLNHVLEKVAVSNQALSYDERVLVASSALEYKTLGDLEAYLKNYVELATPQLKTRLELIWVQQDYALISPQLYLDLSKTLIILIQNSIDHGFSQVSGRDHSDLKPRIHIQIYVKDSLLRFAVKDNGVGVDIKQLYEKLTDGQDDFAALSCLEMLELLYRPGLSTREFATPSAGRGMGLFAVREFCSSYGGESYMECLEERGDHIKFVTHISMKGPGLITQP